MSERERRGDRADVSSCRCASQYRDPHSLANTVTHIRSGPNAGCRAARAVPRRCASQRRDADRRQASRGALGPGVVLVATGELWPKPLPRTPEIWPAARAHAHRRPASRSGRGSEADCGPRAARGRAAHRSARPPARCESARARSARWSGRPTRIACTETEALPAEPHRHQHHRHRHHREGEGQSSARRARWIKACTQAPKQASAAPGAALESASQTIARSPARNPSRHHRATPSQAAIRKYQEQRIVFEESAQAHGAPAAAPESGSPTPHCFHPAR